MAGGTSWLESDCTLTVTFSLLRALTIESLSLSVFDLPSLSTISLDSLSSSSFISESTLGIDNLHFYFPTMEEIERQLRDLI